MAGEPELEFVDTNVLLYAFDRTSARKGAIAQTLVNRLGPERVGCLSVQILQEFYVASAKRGVARAVALEKVELFARWRMHLPSAADVIAAIRLHQRHTLSYWDAMILRSALELRCAVLWSEDLQHGRTWGGLTVRNPFVLE